jgi:hypothetical protein
MGRHRERDRIRVAWQGARAGQILRTALVKPAMNSAAKTQADR